MTLKYRIQKIKFPNENPIFIAQYRILGIWMNIGITRGHFFKETVTYCQCLPEAKDRIKKHRSIMSRSGKWPERETINIYDV